MSFLKHFALPLLAVALVFSSCSKDDDDGPNYAMPSVTSPSTTINVESGASGSVTFTVSKDAALDATYSVTGTGVTIDSPVTGDVTGTSITVDFTAGDTPGEAAVELTVTDEEAQTASATAPIFIGPPSRILTENITGDVTWYADTTYVLNARIVVEDGAMLTIEPGTVIKGEEGQEAAAKALLVARGGKIMAEGTEDLPIIFTTVGDDITHLDIVNGDFGSPNLSPETSGQWGGVIILGYAPISASAESVQIEGILTSDNSGLYGGTDPEDDSGVLSYVSIRHGGTNIGDGNEINGLTLGGVGNKTRIENIEVVANQDDGIEWFGGTVNVTNVVVWNVGDDGIDTDQAWSGTLDNFVVVTVTGHSFELDGPEGSMEGSHTLINGTVIASDEANGIVSENLVNVDPNSMVTLENIFFTGVVLDPAQQIWNSGLDEEPFEDQAPDVNFVNVTLDVPEANLPDHIGYPLVGEVTVGSTPQADASVFGWTWADYAGGLDSIK